LQRLDTTAQHPAISVTSTREPHELATIIATAADRLSDPCIAFERLVVETRHPFHGRGFEDGSIRAIRPPNGLHRTRPCDEVHRVIRKRTRKKIKSKVKKRHRQLIKEAVPALLTELHLGDENPMLGKSKAYRHYVAPL